MRSCQARVETVKYRDPYLGTTRLSGLESFRYYSCICADVLSLQALQREDVSHGRQGMGPNSENSTFPLDD